MPRTAAAIAIILTLLTGIVLGQLQNLGSTRSVAMTDSDPHALQTASRFYQAINSLLETGDPADLRFVLHSGFIDHSHIQQEPGASPELEDYLLLLRQTSPGVRFAASNVAVEGSMVVSSLSITGHSGGEIGDIPVEFEAPPAGYELLRIDDDKVIERWASPTFPVPPQIESVASIDPLAPMISPRTPRLERLTLDQHARYDVSAHGGTIIIVESGALSVHVSRALAVSADPELSDESSGASVASSGIGMLAAGQALTIPSRESFRLVNTDLQIAKVLSLTVPLFDHIDEPGSSPRPDPLPVGITRELQVSGFSLAPNHGPFKLEMYRMQIAPGTSIANHKVAETEILLVDQGNIEVTIRDGAAGLLSELKTVTDQSGIVDLSPGQGIAAPSNVVLEYRATGQTPASFWLVTITPID